MGESGFLHILDVVKTSIYREKILHGVAGTGCVTYARDSKMPYVGTFFGGVSG
jgi:hypothetical protein